MTAFADIDAEDRADRVRRSREPMRLAAWGLGSWLVATVIFCVWTTPVSVDDATDPAFSVGKLAMCAVSGGYVINGSFRFRERDQDADAPSGLIVGAFDCSGEPGDCPPK